MNTRKPARPSAQRIVGRSIPHKSIRRADVTRLQERETSPGMVASIAAAGLSLLAHVPANAESGRSYWSVRNEVAHTTMQYPAAKDPNATATLTVEFATVGNACRPMVGVAVLSGAAYGSRESHGMASGKMSVVVPGHGTWSERPMVVKYSNGIEAGMPAAADLVRALRAGKVVRITMLSGTATFEFALFGASAAFDRAKQSSRACANR
jgi:hypothetical protein